MFLFLFSYNMSWFRKRSNYINVTPHEPHLFSQSFDYVSPDFGLLPASLSYHVSVSNQPPAGSPWLVLSPMLPISLPILISSSISFIFNYLGLKIKTLVRTSLPKLKLFSIFILYTLCKWILSKLPKDASHCCSPLTVSFEDFFGLLFYHFNCVWWQDQDRQST